MMHEGSIGSISRPGQASSVDGELVEGHEPVADRRRRSFSAGPAGDRHPRDRRAHRCDRLGVGGLGDRRHALGLVGEPRHLLGDGLGVGRHPDRPDGGAGQPGQDELRGVVGVEQDLVAHLHPAGVKSGGEPPDVVPQLPVGPRPRGPVGRVPDERRVVGAVLGPECQQPRDVLALHLVAPELGLGRVDSQSRMCHPRILSLDPHLFQTSVGAGPGSEPVAQVALEHLARRIPRQRLEERDVLRDLEAGQLVRGSAP